MSVVNVSAISIGFLLYSLVTNRASLEEECLPRFEVLNCLLYLAASFLDDGNEIPLKVIASYSAVRFYSAVNSFDSSTQLGKIYLLMPVLIKISQFLLFMCTDAFLNVFINIGSSDEVGSLRPVYLLVQVPGEVCAIQKGCGAMLH